MAKKKMREDADLLPVVQPPSNHKPHKIEGEMSHDWGYKAPSAEPLVLPIENGPHADSEEKASHSFTMNFIGGMAILIGACYYMAKNGIKISLPGSAPPKYGRLGADRAGDSDQDDEGDDPAARRRMLELSEFAPKQTGPSQRKVKGKGIVEPSSQWQSEEPSTVSEYPRATFTDQN
jgi:hypothetical protein